MSKVETITLTGKTGVRYQFEVHNMETIFNPIGAIYAFAKKPYYGDPIIHYIGMTGNLSERFDSHHKLPSALRAGANCILVHPVFIESARKNTEADLIAYYKPNLNETLKAFYY